MENKPKRGKKSAEVTATPKRRGQPPKPDAEKRVAVAYRLAPDVVEILRQQPNASRFIDEAVREKATSNKPKA